MRKIVLVLILASLFAVSVSYAQDVLVLDTYGPGTTVMDRVMTELDVEFDHVINYYQAQWNYDDLENYETVIVNMYYGYTDAGVMDDLYEYGAAGGKIIWNGGTGNDQTWVQSLQDDFEIDGQYRYDYAGGFELVDDTHVLAEELPDDQAVYMYNGRNWYDIDDEEFETVAENTAGMSMFGVHQVNNRGEFIYIGMSAYIYYYNTYPDDLELLTQMVSNALSYVRGSLLYGTITNATTGQPVLDVSISLYDADAETLMSEDFSDSMGYYECTHYLLEGAMHYALYDKDFYVGQRIDDLEGMPPDNIEQNITFIPFLVTDIEALQTEVPLNTWVDVTGLVTIPTNTTDIEHTSFYIQDDTQYGIHIYGDDAWDAEAFGDLNRGDEVRIVGRLDEYDNVTEVNDIYLWEVITTDNEVPDPLDMNTGTMSNMQEMEGTWAHIEGFIQNDPAEQGSYTLIANDGSGDCNVRIIESTGIDLLEWEQDDWLMFDGIISLYENVVQIVPALQADITRTPMDAPAFTRIGADALEGDTTQALVTFSWDHTGLGVLDYLSYDGGPPAAYYPWPGHTMGVHFSPKGDSRLVALKLYLLAEGPGNFNINIFHWNPDSAQPGNFQYIEYPVEVTEAYQGWYDVIISDENVNITGDFIAGFGSVDNTIQLATSTYDNECAWDYNGEVWSPWTESYFIRSVVQYADGAFEEIGSDGSEGELDEWTTFNVYRDGEMVGEGLRRTTFTDTLTEVGVYEYSVAAVYHEGETEGTVPMEVWWGMDSVEDQPISSSIPSEWAIASAYPNPFNPAVHVVLAVPQTSKVKAEVFDILGRSVITLVDGQVQAGFHRMNWRADGPSGVYFLKISTESGWSDTRKLVYMK
ncbi:MAG: T9SS type A sorting domain-containing protein [Candidatus Electryonea clarkiae]|nr:T9SS type A sorting domain-containing protein [Candidatus Electryonea clarkiae]MDP8286363.1 T9SS type A sorting domain-containing protein [Candidatus Electryonea clarkiae]